MTELYENRKELDELKKMGVSAEDFAKTLTSFGLNEPLTEKEIKALTRPWWKFWRTYWLVFYANYLGVKICQIWSYFKNFSLELRVTKPHNFIFYVRKCNLKSEKNQYLQTKRISIYIYYVSKLFLL